MNVLNPTDAVATRSTLTVVIQVR